MLAILCHLNKINKKIISLKQSERLFRKKNFQETRTMDNSFQLQRKGSIISNTKRSRPLSHYTTLYSRTQISRDWSGIPFKLSSPSNPPVNF